MAISSNYIGLTDPRRLLVDPQEGSSPSGDYIDPLATPGNRNSNSDWQWDVTESCHLPLSSKAMAYALENDNCEGFNVWTVTFN